MHELLESRAILSISQFPRKILSERTYTRALRIVRVMSRKLPRNITKKKKIKGTERESKSFDISRIQSEACIMVRDYIKKKKLREGEGIIDGKESEEQSGKSERGIARK